MNATQQILKFLEKNHIIRPRDLDPYNIPREYLRRLHMRGILRRVGWGLYVLENGKEMEQQTLIEACKRVPQGVLCLLTALQYHEITAQMPFDVWMAIDRKSWLPQVDHPRIRFMRFSGLALTEGIVEHDVSGVTIRVYNPAKTVADCFKYRNKIGLDVAIEALRDGYRTRKFNVDEIMKYSKVCRVANVIKPYLESII
ncbi:MAG: type IV toxin-antitoxin system AbiEi family antitoxin domain-containing protein [Candidatus Neomarinimicrobiota bacterium]